MTKILLVANTGWYLYNFRRALAHFLRDRGIEVVLVSPRDRFVDYLQQDGFRWVELEMSRRSLNPVTEILAIARLAAIYRKERPHAVHHHTIKCVLYGTIAAKIAGICAVVNAVTGLGHAFVGTGIKARILRPPLRFLYRNILTARRVRVVFQNPDDLQAFAQSHLIVPDKTTLIRSSGVNLDRFAPRLTGTQSSEDLAPIVLFAARLIKDKGILEFVEAARLIKRIRPHSRFQIAGEPDPGSPSSVNERLLDSWRVEGTVEILGRQDNMADVMSRVSMVVLPTHGGEGVPKTLLEASAMGKPCVTTDVPGCREAVVDGWNGLLVAPKNVDALAHAIVKLLDDDVLRARMGRNGRRKMMEEFDERIVIRRTAEVYEAMGVLPTPASLPMAA